MVAFFFEKKLDCRPTATDLVLSTEYKVPVVYKGNLVQAIELTVKWYEFIYKPGTTPMEKDVRVTGFQQFCL